MKTQHLLLTATLLLAFCAGFYYLYQMAQHAGKLN
jgi:hypothetical protein